MDVATAASVTAAVEGLAGLIMATAFLRRRVDREYGVGALLSAAAFVHSIDWHPALRGGGHLSPVLSHGIAVTSLAIAACFAVQVAITHRAVVAPGWARPALYATASAVALVDLLPAWQFGGALASSRATDPNGMATTFAAMFAAAAVVVILAHDTLSGRRTSVLVLIGGAGLLVAAVHDVLASCGLLAPVRVIDLGLAAFVAVVAMTPGAKHASAAAALERVTQELRTRTRELRRSYEDLRTAQEELVKKEQLAVVGELAAVIAHEVRNPLAIIANAGAGLRKQNITRDDYEVLLAILDEETSRLNRLVTDLLRYARPVSLQRSQFPLAELLDRALAVPDRSLKDIQLNLKMEVHDARLWGDSNLLRQVFDNLIDNAIQAMGPGGCLTVRVRAAMRDGSDGLDVAFIDTGEGMDTQVRSRALDPFFTTRPSGTGLGLAIVDRIIEAHGGRLDIESRSGEGTTVTVFLPHGSPSEPPPGRTRSTRPPSDPRRRSSQLVRGPDDFGGE